jgi:hypothetical protein
MQAQPSQVDNLKAYLNMMKQAANTPTPADFVQLGKTLVGMVNDAKANLLREVRVATGRNELRIKDAEKKMEAVQKKCLEAVSKSDSSQKEALRREVRKMEDLIDSLPDVNEKIAPLATKTSVNALLQKIVGVMRLVRELSNKVDKLLALEKRVEDLATRRTGGITGMRKVPIIKRVNLTEQIDGNTRAFKLPKDTVAIVGVFGTQFPITFDEADWEFVGNTLTLASGITTPESGQTLFVIVETLFY